MNHRSCSSHTHSGASLSPWAIINSNYTIIYSTKIKREASLHTFMTKQNLSLAHFKESAHPFHVQSIFIGEIKEIVYIKIYIWAFFTSIMWLIIFFQLQTDLYCLFLNFLAFSIWSFNLFPFFVYFLAQMRIPVVLDLIICSTR